MARLIMAGVATCDMYDGDNLFGTATTLTESSLNIGISAEDVRGGEGAGLLGRYFHTSTFELTLTDALFNLDYIAASVGAKIETGANVMMNEQITATESGKLTLKKKAVALNGCSATAKVYAWYRLSSAEEWKTVEVADTTLTAADIVKDSVYCVKYFYKESAAEKIRIASDYVPKTLRLVLKENLYAAGENNNNTTKVGYILINIPRFQLDGSQELSMSMTGASTTSLKGMALISDGCESGCEGAGYYADMIQVLDGAKWYDGITAIAVDGGKAVAGKDAQIYAIYSNKTPKLISKDMLTVTKVVDGKDVTSKLTLVGPDGVTWTDITAAGEGEGIVTLNDGDNVIASGAIVVVAAQA